MFKTVKAKILVTILLMLAVLMSVFFCYAYEFRYKTKNLMLKNYSFAINPFVHQMDMTILSFEDNSRDLALIGSLFYKKDKDVELTKTVINKIFENYNHSLGGGIWFEPYVFGKDKKRLCFYMYRNKNNKLVFDENFENDEYNYHNQNWYKEIKSRVTKEKNTAWSLPYYEKQGSNTMMITVGTGIFDGDKFIGMSTVDWKLESIFNDISEMKPLENGFSFFQNNAQIKDSFSLFASKKDDYIIALTDPFLKDKDFTGKKLSSVPWYRDDLNTITYFSYHGKKYVPYVKTVPNGMMLIICIPKSEMFKEINRVTASMLILLTLFCFLIPSLLYFILHRYVIKPIDTLTDIAKKIGSGQDVQIKLEKPEEFAQLAMTFDKMTNDIKSITVEKQKINSELAIAKLIQESSLPNVFPPYPDNSDFDIFASMETAKEVGGDFYDFYFIDKDNFMFLIADVSGKGVPAALFMMTVKTHINNLALSGYSPEELIKKANNKICENNKQNYFVTMLVATVNIKTGKLTLINCGHNLPLLKHKNDEYEFINLHPNLPLGLFEDFDFQIYETQLKTGDILYLYTDGVTEALNINEEMYGEKRLMDYLNNIKNIQNVNDIIQNVKSDLKQYTDSVPQSDDITMLGFKYNYSSEKTDNSYCCKADIANYSSVYDWLNEIMKDWHLNEELVNKIHLCAEEIFINISSYAYREEKGMIEISFNKKNDKTELKFTDTGFAYNPLEKPDPDITLPPEERTPGGLGIFMVKKSADDVIYERNGDKNILTIIFNCN